MKRNEVLYLVGGLIAGLVLGIILIGNSDSLRQDLFGTTVNPVPERDNAVEIDAYSYFLVDFTEIQEWMAMIDPNDGQQLGDDFKKVGDLASLVDVSQYFTDGTQESINSVLSTVHTTLTEKAFSSLQNALIQTCIGLDRAAADGAVYMYLEVPNEVIDQLPATWQKLDTPPQNSLLWSMECYQKQQ